MVRELQIGNCKFQIENWSGKRRAAQSDSERCAAVPPRGCASGERMELSGWGWVFGVVGVHVF